MMVRYIVSRLFQSAVTMLVIAAIAFVVVRLSGDPIKLLLPTEATKHDEQQIRHAFGLDRPIPVQFVAYLGDLSRADFGKSIHFSEDARKVVTDRFPATLQLSLCAMAIAIIVGVSLGITAAVYRHTPLDKVCTLLAITGQAMPTFWLGLLLILLLAVKWQVLPTSGRGSWQHLILPSFTLGWFACGAIMRMTRSSMLDVLRRDYIRTARAKGLQGRAVVLRHGFRNALLPIVTLIGLQMATLIGGSIVVETVFAWPGVGQATLTAIKSRDYPVVQAAVILTALWLVTVNLIIDLSYTVIDPRIRLGRGAER
jgi:peptide/nickel transport system permease protein